MEKQLPKRIFGEGVEPEVGQINNCCRTSILCAVKKKLRRDYRQVRANPVFGHIMAIHDNGLAYSARLIHSFLCRQLDTDKLHELWFVFGRRPFRFSIQEFHAVTGLKYEMANDAEAPNWIDDGGFWSALLREGKNISLKTIRQEHLPVCHDWPREDRLRLVYVCVIGGMLFPMDERTHIPHKYIRLVMNVAKRQSYHWGLDSFDHLLKALKNARPKLTQAGNYVLHGFTYAFQIWIMEAIPEFGTMVGKKKIADTVVFPRCSNWAGSGVLKYCEINNLEVHFGADAVSYPFISALGDGTAFRGIERTQEMRDDRVDHIYDLLKTKTDWTNHVWETLEAEEVLLPEIVTDNIDDMENEIFSDGGESEEEFNTPQPDMGTPASSSRKGKSKVRDYGVLERKQKVLCARATATNVSMIDEMKSFLRSEFQEAFGTLDAKIDSKIDLALGDRFSVVHTEMRVLRDEVRATKLSTYREEAFGTAKDHTRTAKRNKAKKNGNNTPTVDIPAVFDNLTDIPVTQSSDVEFGCKSSDLDDINLSSEEWLDKTFKKYAHASSSKAAAPTSSAPPKAAAPTTSAPPKAAAPTSSAPPKTAAPTSSTRSKNKVQKCHNWFAGRLDSQTYNEPDAPLTMHEVDSKMNELVEWGKGTAQPILPFGPTIFSYDLADRFVCTNKWLASEDMDAYMFLLREKTTLQHYPVDRVGFMSCNFSQHILWDYKLLTNNKKEYVVTTLLVNYGKGLLPAHGMTQKVWDIDVDRIYVPFNIHATHWIALCINFQLREVRVFDCGNGTTNKDVQAFAHIIPRIVKAVHPPANRKDLKIIPYKIEYEMMREGLNRSKMHCGPYALKYIEAHMRGMSCSLLNDSNIRFARHKMGVDMWVAAQDPVFIERMKLYKPPASNLDPKIVNLSEEEIADL